MMRLSKENLQKIIANDGVVMPTADQLKLPEKVLQFGTGVLLRGLPDYFIDKANKLGVFNGRIVVIKSMYSGSTDTFDQQDGLYTLWVRGLENDENANEYIINASISRVLSAKSQWLQVLAFARNPALQLIVSNTTELGIVASEDNINDEPPTSFPGKLLSVLYARYKALGAGEASGLVIIPTELIIDNGKKLKEIIIQLAHQNRLESEFINWIQHENHFCNSLVDRIVPGKIDDKEKMATAAFLGYEDELMIVSEVFRLWAIEADHKKVKEVLSFASVDEGLVIAPNIEKFRELKLRLLNGTHTLACALAHLGGFITVKEAMMDDHFEAFVQRLTKNELAPVLQSSGISYKETIAFAEKVIERFKNPFTAHKWLSISFAYTSKMLARNIPVIKSFFAQPVTEPSAIALGFAAYVLFMKCTKEGNEYIGVANGNPYVVNDDKAVIFSAAWATNHPDAVVDAVLSSQELWEENLLIILPQFAGQTKQFLKELINDGATATLNKFVRLENKK